MSFSQESSGRVLLVSGDFVRTGGMDMANFQLASYIAERANEVHIVSHKVDSDLLERENVRWHRAFRPRGSTLLGEPQLRWVGKRVAARLAALPGPTTIVVNGGNCPLAGVNWVHYLHASTEAMPTRTPIRQLKSKIAHRQFCRLERIALQRAKVIIANSERTKRDIIRFHEVEASLVHTVYCGIDPNKFYPASSDEQRTIRERLGLPLDKYIFVFIGALGDRRKGIDKIFEAWEKIGQETLDTMLLVIGSGAELAHWKSKAAALKGGNQLLFLGSRTDVPDILRASDALVAPARYESFGMAVQEALCCGLPAIVSRDAGVAERYPVSLNDLLLEDPESATELAARMRRLIADRARWINAVRPVAASLREYTWQDMARAIAGIIVRR